MKHEAQLPELRPREKPALLFALAIVLVVAILSYRGWTAFGRHADQVEVTQQTLSGTRALLSSLTDAETGQRGYLLTGEDRYLDPYRQALIDIPVILKALETVTRARSDQFQRAEGLKPLINEKLAELALTVELRRSKSFNAALAVVRSDRGRLLMSQVREICWKIEAVTNERLTQYSNHARSNGNLGGLASILGCTSLFLLLLVANRTIGKGVGRREALITKLKHSERQFEEAAAAADAANRAKSVFLSTISHEIRTPLNAILGYAQLMLREEGLGEDAKTHLKIIGRSGEHLLTLINGVLDMSKIEAGHVELNPITFSLSSLLEDLAAMFRLRAEAKALRFEMLVQGESVKYVVADEGKLRQVLINLLGNAIKFTRRGEVKLQINLEQRSGDRLWLAVRVEDSGPGISQEEQKRLFEPFGQSASGLNIQEGTGLGLAISREYARLMGGDITFTSVSGKGSIFLLELPIEVGDASVAVRHAAPRHVTRLRVGAQGTRILVVDDQLENRDWLMKLLGLLGFSVRGATNGQEAILRWEEWNPQMILMDVHMPVMDGIEATRRIKAEARGKETVILVLTASALNEDQRMISDSGAEDFLSKPCREDELLEKIRVHLNVTYDYEEMNSDKSQPLSGIAALSAQRLGLLPRELIEKLRDATSDGNKKGLDALIQMVRQAEDSVSANALQKLADTYEYDALVRVFEEVCH